MNSNGKRITNVIFINLIYIIQDVVFVDFTYKRENDELQRNNLLNALEVIETLKSSVKKADEKSKINKLSSEIKPKLIIDNFNIDFKEK